MNIKTIALICSIHAIIFPGCGFSQDGEIDLSLVYFAVDGDGVSSGYDADPFVQEVNAAWMETNYPRIKTAITNRLAENTNDLLAMGLLFEYYRVAEVDYLAAKAAAQAYVLAVSNRVPEEIIKERVPMASPIHISRESNPTNLPYHARSPEKIEYMHKTYSNAFPHIKLFQILDWRIGATENGTFNWEVGPIDPEE